MTGWGGRFGGRPIFHILMHFQLFERQLNVTSAFKSSDRLLV